MIMRDRVSLRLSWAGVFGVALLLALTLPAWSVRAATGGPQSQPPATVVNVSRSSPPAIVRVVEAPRQALPADAQRLIDRFAEQEAAARREADAKIAEQRRETLRRLQALQESLARAGRTVEAGAVRRSMARLRQTAEVPVERGLMQWLERDAQSARLDWTRLAPSSFEIVLAPRGSLDLRQYRGETGRSFSLPVVGSLEGSVWGDGVYTDDSSLAAAAVHAGAVDPGRLGFVLVTILPGQDAYDGARRNGVSSQSYGAWDGSFRVERDPNPSPVVRLADDGSSRLSLESLRGQDGASLTVEVVGASPPGPVWGTDVYTDDSSIGAAAVHAGVLKPGERGLVRVTILPGRQSYEGSTRNGVRSESYEEWGGSFRIERARE